MHGLEVGNLKIAVESSTPGRLILHWTGSSNSPNECNSLRPFLALSLAEASAKKAVLELHFERLRHFNSSTISVILRFAEEAKAIAVKLVLCYDGSLRWQAHNFEAIAALEAPGGLLEVRNVGSAKQPEKVG